MPHPLDAFITRHRLDPEARAELEKMMADASSGAWASRSVDLRQSADDLWSISALAAEASTPGEGTAATAMTAATADGPARPAVTSTAPPPAFDRRYVDQGPLGAGGMGEVRRVYDRFLARSVALKQLHWKLLDDGHARARFDAESSMTAGLEHPGIVPVYDRGANADGSPWFTMKFVRGRTLAAVAADGASARELVEIFVGVCDAMAYAHARGVVHRDLKPGNVMVGEFGEVLVMDWGLARRLGASDAPLDPLAPTEAEVPARPELTGADDLLGTPAYMPPEQISRRFGAIGPHSDVYALGATLYRLVAGRHAYPGPPRAIWSAVLTNQPPALDAGPPALWPIVARCMAHDPSDRYPDAAAVRDEVRRWVDGEARRIKARKLVLDAVRLRPKSRHLRADAVRIEDEASAILGPLPPFAPIDQKAPGWALEDQAAETRRAARLADVAYLQALRNALEVDPELPEARHALDGYYRERLLDAEARRDADSAAEYAALLRAHDPTGNAEWLRGDGAVTLFTDPPGASVKLYRYVEERRRLVPRFEREMPSTPFVDVPLAMGSWLLKIEAPGYRPVDYPVHIERAGRWDGIRPGDDAPHAIWLPPAGSLGEDECYVPAGWFIGGGDPEAPDGLPRQRVWLDGYVIERYPVTNARYMTWLDSLATDGRREQALARVPRADAAGQGTVRMAYTLGEDGRFHIDGGFDLNWAPDWPVVNVDWHAAMAYAAHRRDAERAWRLPHEWEWEKAARGVDGRRYPWGDRLERTYALMNGSRPGPTSIGPVTGFPLDESPYGLRGASGNVRDLCLNRYARRGPLPDGDGVRLSPIESPTVTPEDFMIVRGGSCISSPSFCLTATRFGLPPSRALGSVGFRLARPASAEVGAQR